MARPKPRKKTAKVAGKARPAPPKARPAPAARPLATPKPMAPRQPAPAPVAPPQAPVPPPGLSAPFVIEDLNAIPSTPCPCGSSRRAFLRPDNRVCSVHRVLISRSAKAHYHKTLTEVYYILDGEGHVELDGTLHPVKQGMAIMIRPGTRHRAVVGEMPMRILNVVVPPFDPKDEWTD
jgi:mannose-6-phosphate isomerase-like protein (cupin superfamily)